MLGDNDNGISHPFNLKDGYIYEKMVIILILFFFWNNFHGYLLGNPITKYKFDHEAKIPFVHRMSLISSEHDQVL